MSLDTIDKFDLLGVAFSTNSELLYVATGKELYQLVLYEPEPFKNKELIATIDGFQSFPGFPSYFHLMQLAPDRKIYICNGRGPTYLSTIEYPDRRGKSCKVMQHNISIVANSSMPNFPYFRLGAAKGTICDSIITSVVDATLDIDDSTVNIIPNPSNGQFRLIFDEVSMKLNPYIEVFNSNGVKINSFKLNISSSDLNLELLPGIYYLKIINSEGDQITKKLLIVK